MREQCGHENYMCCDSDVHVVHVEWVNELQEEGHQLSLE